MAEAVKVAVRVRPFNGRELERAAKVIIKMDGNTTYISDPNDPGAEPRKFTFDYSYWSHDGFDTRPDGVLVPQAGGQYSDQQRVFDDLGRGVLANAFAGFNTSLFAYGQTGSGKSYSIVGYGNNKGIVPMVCDNLFLTIEENKRGGNAVRYQVTLSMLEVYNEQVRDLLTKDASCKGLPVRQDTNLNKFYVQGLSKVQVHSYTEIERRIAEGTANRTLAATKMNATSSRAHTVVTILFEQIQKNAEGKEMTKSSEINLVDLAGSERAASTGATGDTLKEGSMINKSLSCLGNVISALAELSTNKKSKIVVPYRDSVLTKLLQNSLGGNSKTIMIAALSPADINFEETLSTLRYADRAKQIKTLAVVNESATDKLIRTLKEENERLKKMLEGGGAPAAGGGVGGGVGASGPMSEEERAALRRQVEEELSAQMEENMRAIQADEMGRKAPVAGGQSQTLEEMQREKEEQLKKQKLATLPHLSNLNEDPLLCGLVYQFLEKPTTVIGKSDASSSPDMVLNGLRIRKEHAIIAVSKAKVTIKPGNPLSKTTVNGAVLTAELELKHCDRILFGSNHLYLFLNPASPAKSPGTPDSVTWEFAQNEIAKAKGFQTDHSGLSADQLRIQEQVLELLPLLSEANAIGEEMSKQRVFELALMSGIARGERGRDVATEALVKVKNLLNGNEWLWSREKFMDRRFLFQSLYQDWTETDNASLAGPPHKGDPFYDPAEDLLIGTASAFLQSLAFTLDFEDTLSIVDYRGEEQGRVRVMVTPCNAQGGPLGDDATVDEPSELLEKPFHFTVTIASVDINKARFSKGVSVKYNMFGQTAEISTPVQRGLSVPFNYIKQFDFKKVKPDLLEWFENGCLSFRIYAAQEETDDTALARGAGARRMSLDRVSFVRERTSTAVSVIKEDEVFVGSQATSQARVDTAAATAAAVTAALEAASVQDAQRTRDLQARIDALESELTQVRQRTPPPAITVQQQLAPATDKFRERIGELERDVAQADMKYSAREKRLHTVLDQWFAKPPTEQSFEGLHQAVSLVVSAPDRFRRPTLAERAHKNSMKLVPPSVTVAPGPDASRTDGSMPVGSSSVGSSSARGRSPAPGAAGAARPESASAKSVPNAASKSCSIQ